MANIEHHGSNFSVQGKLLSDWQKDLGYEYQLSELVTIVREGGDLQKMVLRKNGFLTLD